MAYSAKHRARPRLTSLRRRVAGGSLAAAASIAIVGASAPSASAFEDVWERVAECESSGNWSINTGNGYYGGLQFYQPTWRGYGGTEYASYAHQATKSEQIAIARRVLHGQGPGAWPVCSREAGLTRSNGGADPNATPGGGGGSQPAPSPAPAPSPSPSPSPSPAPAPAPAPGQEVTRYVSANTAAYVRSGPSTGYRVVDSIARGTEVDGTLVGGWLKIGDGRFVGPAVLSSSPVGGGGGGGVVTPGDTTRYVSANYAANVRSGPGFGYGVVDTVDRGTEVSGTVESGWLKIGNGRYIGLSVTSANPV